MARFGPFIAYAGMWTSLTVAMLLFMDGERWGGMSAVTAAVLLE